MAEYLDPARPAGEAGAEESVPPRVFREEGPQRGRGVEAVGRRGPGVAEAVNGDETNLAARRTGGRHAMGCATGRGRSGGGAVVARAPVG